MESLTLKWGTLKRWDVNTEASIAALNKYFEAPVSMSAMAQRDTPDQKKAICELIDVLDAELIYLDWEGRFVTKEKAKKYVMENGE